MKMKIRKEARGCDYRSTFNIHSFFVRTSKFKFRLTALNFFENLRLDCS